jgi:hypothetical protein
MAIAGEPDASAFNYAAPHAMDCGRARALGWRPMRIDEALDGLIDAHAAALAGVGA